MMWNKDERKPASQRGYGAVWEKVRKMKLQETPLCEYCNGLKRAWGVHHLDEDPYNSDPDNLKSICFVCHERLHGRMKSPAGYGADGMPLDPKHPWATKKGE